MLLNNDIVLYALVYVNTKFATHTAVILNTILCVSVSVYSPITTHRSVALPRDFSIDFRFK